MKKIIFASLCGLSLMACQPKHDGYTIHGNIAGSKDGLKVSLLKKATYPLVAFDSTVIHNGKFLFNGKLDHPGNYWIIIENGEETLGSNFYLENSDITYSSHIDSLQSYFWSEDTFRKEAVVTGSATQELYNQYKEAIRELNEQYSNLEKNYDKVYFDPDLNDTLKTQKGIVLARQMEKLEKDKQIVQWNFIERHPGSIVAYDLAYQFLDGMFVDLTAQQIDQLGGIIGKAWAARPDKIADFKAKAEKTKPLAQGSRYPDIDLINTKGEEVKLSEYVPQGKYVLLEFWASWCGPCRGEIPHLRQVYKEYKDKGFEIVSVSIDDNKANWDKAVKEEKMVWKQLCDPQDFNGPVAKVYNVQGVPHCILLDKEGRIFKTNMRGAALNAVLQDLFQ